VGVPSKTDINLVITILVIAVVVKLITAITGIVITRFMSVLLGTPTRY
jgi:hypothetical protein